MNDLTTYLASRVEALILEVAALREEIAKLKADQELRPIAYFPTTTPAPAYPFEPWCKTTCSRTTDT